MEWYWALFVLLGAILFLMIMGTPVGVAFLAVNFVAAVYWFGGSSENIFERMELGMSTLVGNAYQSMATFALVPIPMFLLMGELFFHTGLANRMFNAVEKLMGRVPARLSYVTVAGGTIFATLSGSSMGSTALLGTLMVPEMSRRGYKKHMSIGPILGTGGLAMLIPPSALAVLLGTLAELDIGKLLIAGVVPGIILAVAYAVMIYVRAKIDPNAAPAYDVEVLPGMQRFLMFMTDVVPMVAVVVVVILLIMLGITTPSEAAAFGCFGVIVLGIVYSLFTAKRYLSVDIMRKSLYGTARVTVMSLFIIFGSSTFSQILSFSGASKGLVDYVTAFEVSRLVMLLLMFGILLILGMFMDQLSMMLLTVPIFFPIAKELGFDLIWFGVIILLALEISFTTPPFGLLLFVMQGVAPPGTRFSEICVAAIPYMLCAMGLVALLIVFPEIATWLPSLSKAGPG